MPLRTSLDMLILFSIPDKNYFVLGEYGGQEDTCGYTFLQGKRYKIMVQSSRI